MIQQLAFDQQMVWYDDQWVVEPLTSIFDAEYWAIQQKILGSAQGRGTTWFVDMQQTKAALRHYRRGGLLAKILRDGYWFHGWHKTRSYAEFHLLAFLHQQGVNVPRPIAARAVRCGLFYRADILSEKIANARDLVALLQEVALTPDDYWAVGQEIGKLHRAQVNHTDLNIHNILLDQQGKVWIIDFDKCRQQAGDDWKADNLQRLLRSFKKEQIRAGINWQEQEWSLLLAGYDGSEVISSEP